MIFLRNVVLPFATFLFFLHSFRNFRSEHSDEMAKLAAAESENSNTETVLDVPTAKTPSNKRPAMSPAAGKASAGPSTSKKGFVTHTVASKYFSIFKNG